MCSLQGALDKAIRKEFSFARMGAKVLERRLAQLGVDLTDVQKRKLQDQLTRNDIGSLSLNLDDSQVPAHILATHPPDDGKLIIELGNTEPIIDDLARQLSDQLMVVVPRIASEIGDGITNTLMQRSRRMLKSRRKETARYESRLIKSWQRSLDSLETMIVIATEAGEECNGQLRAAPHQDLPHLIEAATRLHARSCQVSSEILTLLKSGYSDGAHARWRCLHEIAVVLFFLAAKGDDIAEAYLLHGAIDSYRAAQIYQQQCERLGFEPYSDDEMHKFAEDRTALLNRYGPLYGEEYGWAAITLGKKHTTFRDIEDSIELKHMRPYYKMASHNVHANPKGIYFRLGLSSDESDILLAGPSSYGLTDPGQGVAVSLLQTTTALLTIEPNLDRLVMCNVLKNVADRAQEAFLLSDE